MAKRLVRGKNKIRNAGIALRVPDPKALPGRLDAVLRVIYLIYTEGHMASGGDQLVRGDLCDLAIHLAREMLRLLPSEPEVSGLLSLLLLTDSRRHARVDARGQLVLLSNQDRSRWNQDQIIEGRELVLEALRIGRPGRYQLWAAIAASHSEASSAAEIDWIEILGLYDALLDYEPTDVVHANRAIAVAMVHGAVAGLEILDSLDAKAAMNNWPQWHVARAELLRQLQRTEDAIEAYSGALAAVPSSVASEHLRRRRDELVSSGRSPDRP